MRYKTFAINLKSNEYRRNHILQQQEKSGLDITIFDAVTPNTLNTVNFNYRTIGAKWFTGRELMPTEIACALSHICLWQNLMTDIETDYYLIMEDDINIEDNISSLLKKIDFNNIDFLKLSGQCTRPERITRAVDDHYSLVRYAFGPLDAACYLLSKKAARSFLDYCRNLRAPIDILMDRSYEHKIPVYGIKPYPVQTSFCFDKKNPLHSDVGVRNDDYKKARTMSMILSMRYHRVISGIKKKIATVKLHANP